MNSNISRMIKSIHVQIESGLKKTVNAIHALAKKCKKEIEIQKIKYKNKICNHSCNCHNKSTNIVNKSNIKSNKPKKRKKRRNKEPSTNANKANEPKQTKCTKALSKSTNDQEEQSSNEKQSTQSKCHNTSKNELRKTENSNQKKLEKRKKKKKSRKKKQNKENVDNKGGQNNLESTRYLPEIEDDKDTNKLSQSISFYNQDFTIEAPYNSTKNENEDTNEIAKAQTDKLNETEITDLKSKIDGLSEEDRWKLFKESRDYWLRLNKTRVEQENSTKRQPLNKSTGNLSRICVYHLIENILEVAVAIEA